MPNLVGIGNTQVPTNAMLGGLAYQDSVGEINLDKIKARTSDTATDIFVYDTSKDSDGGAWRHRTQNTSWYNEGASATRGARKEFPAVAVIVSITNGLMIYDGDDPNLPLWMEWTTTNGSKMLRGPTNGKIAAMNGIIALSSASTYGGVVVIYFISDTSRSYRQLGSNNNSEGHFVGDGIAARNDFSGNCYSNSSGGHILPSLVDENTKDVAMTVLPNASIDADTELPIPTIAVATIGGLSVIKDDGSIADVTATGYTANDNKIDFDHLNNLIYIENAGFPQRQTVPSADISRHDAGSGRDRVYGGTSSYIPTILGTATNIVPDFHGFVCGSTSGLTILDYDSSQSQDMVAYAATSYNTGWMHGDIKGAFLSDSDDTNITGTSLIANGDFSSSSTAAFTTVAGGTAAVVGGLLKLTDTGGAFAYASAPFTTVVGNQYFVTVDIVNNSNTAPSNYIRCGNSHNGTEFHNTNYGTGYGTKTFYFTATATTTYLTLISGHGAGNPFGHWDNVFAYKLDNDRSVSSKGLQPYGTITKEPVATGAELVAYSNFSNSRYLFQPYNSDLNFTDTMSIMFWVKDWVGSDSLLHRGPGTTRNSKTSFHLYCTYDYNYRLTLTTDGSSEITFEIPLSANQIGWQHLCFTLSGGVVRGFLNGKEKTLSRTSFSGNIFSQATDQNGLWIGTGPVGGAADTASLALLRLSASAPSAEQVKKMYNDEKCLYHVNAKCTLHGSSDDVKALAFDDTTNVLHVGTSSGRTEFQGLNRINNTTTAVTTAISASNEFVAEQ